ncbi:hypothetical protein K0M31_001460 [Melipona bicolor]|uniref:Uncharacterized protein n=1 Tax=Melipona bicolor TaxID=60889 RepID=A0AA40GFK0_9HYME|nr:hypothetical protein K0M31_001460 [Melipona bicolor]
MLLAVDRSLIGLYRRRIGSEGPPVSSVERSSEARNGGFEAGCNTQTHTEGRKKHWPGKVFKSVIFPAISLSWCVASGLTGPPGPGEHELEEGLSLSSPPILAHHLHPPAEIHGEDQGSTGERSRRTDGEHA